MSGRNSRWVAVYPMYLEANLDKELLLLDVFNEELLPARSRWRCPLVSLHLLKAPATIDVAFEEKRELVPDVYFAFADKASQLHGSLLSIDQNQKPIRKDGLAGTLLLLLAVTLPWSFSRGSVGGSASYPFGAIRPCGKQETSQLTFRMIWTQFAYQGLVFL